MPKYGYTLYSQDGTVTTDFRTNKFTLAELKNFIGGRIEILPIKIPEISSVYDVYIVSEDGAHYLQPNPMFPEFYGPVLATTKKLLN